MKRHHIFNGIAAIVPLLAGAGTAAAQAFPSKTLRLVVPFPAGGSNDVVARALSTPLSQALGQSVVVENRAGANTISAPRRWRVRRPMGIPC